MSASSSAVERWTELVRWMSPPGRHRTMAAGRHGGVTEGGTHVRRSCPGDGPRQKKLSGLRYGSGRGLCGCPRFCKEILLTSSAVRSAAIGAQQATASKTHLTSGMFQPGGPKTGSGSTPKSRAGGSPINYRDKLTSPNWCSLLFHTDLILHHHSRRFLCRR